jgi:hypothetical protein
MNEKFMNKTLKGSSKTLWQPQKAQKSQKSS